MYGGKTGRGGALGGGGAWRSVAACLDTKKLNKMAVEKIKKKNKFTLCWLAKSAVSIDVGRSISLCFWIPSPGPICEIWLKFVGAEIIFDLRSVL